MCEYRLTAIHHFLSHSTTPYTYDNTSIPSTLVASTRPTRRISASDLDFTLSTTTYDPSEHNPGKTPYSHISPLLSTSEDLIMAKPTIQITSLGSSFAAGPGIPPEVNPVTRTSAKNHPRLLQKALGDECKLHDASSSGATLLNILSDPQEMVMHRTSLPPQIDGVPPTSHIVTVTAGGNDMGYSRAMIADAARASIGDPDFLSAFLEMLGLPASGAAEPADADGEEVARRFVRVVDAVRERCGRDVKVYLVEYVDVFGPASFARAADQPLSAERVEHFIGMSNTLRKAYRDAAAARSGEGGDAGWKAVEVVSMSDLSRGHEVGSAEPWVTGFEVGMFREGLVPFHPNAAGHEAVARELERRVRGEVGVRS